MLAKSGQSGQWKALDHQHGIFGKKIPSTLSKVSRIWLLLRVATLWTTGLKEITLPLTIGGRQTNSMTSDLGISSWVQDFQIISIVAFF